MLPIFQRIWGLIWSLLLTTIAALPTLNTGSEGEHALRSRVVVLPPSQDPFYTAPAHFASTAPGTVLRVRSAPGNLTAVAGNSSAAYHILFRTTDSHYKPSWAVTTLFVPLYPCTFSTSGGGSSLLSYQIAYDSADVDASPSYALFSRSDIITTTAVSRFTTALASGWYVNVPDYEGPLASFGAGVQSGHATLDSVRAVLSTGFGLASDARYAMWGYSGGALASGWAAELQVQYAPELDFAGAALGGLPSNATSALLVVNGQPAAGLIPSALLGLTSQYPQARDFLIGQLHKTGRYNATTFLMAEHMTLLQSAVTFADKNVFGYFVDGTAILEAPIVQTILNRDGILGYHGVPQMPIFAYKAIKDEIALTSITDALMARYCAEGANILYHRNTVGGHAAESVNEDSVAFEWLSTVLAGTYADFFPTRGCTIQNVTVIATA